ncbi:MAG: DUF2778 domain-containing protein [Alphaproteobacteria bacterium]|nr:DUF2778 domain-containing protein [Alphaproteobacteria bacterium]
MYGLKPVHRDEPREGQSEWYYLDPRYDDDDERHQIDVESENTPHPYAREIQNYLYNNDEYRYKSLYGDTPPSMQTQNNNDPNCYMIFDGQNLGLYNNTGQVGSLDAQSGHDDFQSAQYQNVADKGPIPEGTYYANQDQRQSLTPKNIALKLGEKLGFDMNQKSDWSGNPISWGTSRVWLQPDDNTNTYGRSGFTIHGGLAKGSRGCIDIPWQTGKLNNYLDDCQDSVPIYVKYPKGW